ncbi:MAG: hypothetical protein R3Y33_07735 [Clostridia bacterium]
MDSQKCQEHDIELEIYKDYQDKIIPFIVTLETLDGAFPVEILNEIRAIFTHFSAYKLKNSTDDLYLASRHMKRAFLDCHKYFCVSMEEQIKTFRNDYRNIDLGIADNGNFLPKFNELHQIARCKLIEARRLESVLNNTFEENNENSRQLYKNYEDAWIAYDDLDCFLKKSNKAILFANNKSKKADRFNILAIIFGIIGVIGTAFTVISFFC